MKIPRLTNLVQFKQLQRDNICRVTGLFMSKNPHICNYALSFNRCPLNIHICHITTFFFITSTHFIRGKELEEFRIIVKHLHLIKYLYHYSRAHIQHIHNRGHPFMTSRKYSRFFTHRPKPLAHQRHNQITPSLWTSHKDLSNPLPLTKTSGSGKYPKKGVVFINALEALITSKRLNGLVNRGLQLAGRKQTSYIEN